uniref:Uncharacterized protein n=1 Tax=Rhizophora mucronata TaxID=61149 RepID=A0A2P2NNI0_RHIMU
MISGFCFSFFFARHFSIIVLAIDYAEARSYINSMDCSFLGVHSFPI